MNYYLDASNVRIYIVMVRTLIISPAILEKLQTKHDVSRRDIEQCFDNRIGDYLEDADEDHQTDPPSLWFVAPTNCDQLLKIIFVFQDGNIYVKSAFPANAKAIKLYETHGK